MDTDKINTHLLTIPVLYRDLLTRALTNGNSNAEAIKAKCLDCVGFENALDRIKNCASFRCPLNPVRPYQDKPVSDKPKKQISAGLKAYMEKKKASKDLKV